MLTSGMLLTVPAKVGNVHNTADTFRPYDPNKALGDLNPTQPEPPRTPRKGGCGVVGQIIAVVIAVVVTAMTYGALSAVNGGILGAIGGNAVAAGAVAGAAGSVASQGFLIATGAQDGFDWKGLALAAIAGGVGGGLKAFPETLAKSAMLADVARGALGNVITQGVAVATGLQDRFDWTGVAVGGIAGGVFGGVSRKIASWAPSDGWVNQSISGAAAAGAGAAARSLIDGTNFGDNVLAALPDVIGRTIGLMAAAGIANAGRPKPGTDRRPERGQSSGPVEVLEPFEATTLTELDLRMPEIIASPSGGRRVIIGFEDGDLDSSWRNLNPALTAARQEFGGSMYPLAWERMPDGSREVRFPMRFVKEEQSGGFYDLPTDRRDRIVVSTRTEDHLELRFLDAVSAPDGVGRFAVFNHTTGAYGSGVITGGGTFDVAGLHLSIPVHPLNGASVSAIANAAVTENLIDKAATVERFLSDPVGTVGGVAQAGFDFASRLSRQMNGTYTVQEYQRDGQAAQAWLSGAYNDGLRAHREDRLAAYVFRPLAYNLPDMMAGALFPAASTSNSIAQNGLRTGIREAAKGAGAADDAFSHGYAYADRVRARGVQDPVSHNFPYTFDDAILKASPIPKANGYNIYQMPGTMGKKSGVFEIGVTKDGVIDHRFFRPDK